MLRVVAMFFSSMVLTGMPAAPTPQAVGPSGAIGETAAAALIAAQPQVAATMAAQADGYTEEGFRAYLPELRAQALAAGVRQDTVDRIFPALTFSARTIQLDRAQPGGTPSTASSPASNPPFAPYLARQVTPALVAQGRSRFEANSGALARISQRYGVDPTVLVAIWGKETGFGRIMGNFDLMNSLASLAYEGRRRELFAAEFIAVLKMHERGFPRSSLQGSWAGATGQSQFLPSVYLRLGVDGDGDGRADIWGSSTDALASIANYLSNAGWRPGVPWGTRAVVPAGFDRAQVANTLRSPRCTRVFERHSRWLTLAEWRRLGVVPAGSTNGIAETEQLSLLEPDGPGETAYLLTTNYRTILDYNCSNFYALTVSLLADGISR